MGKPMNLLALLLLLLSGCSDGDGLTVPDDPDPPEPSADVAVEVVVSGLSNPLYLTAPPGDSRLFAVEQPGRIRVIEDGSLLASPFLDLTAQVQSGGERGLLSLAFHPDYASNGFFYVNYTDANGDTRVERYGVSNDPNVADPGSGVLVLSVDQPFGNHNGGLLAFGPDGMLYIGMGDGGSAGDPQGHGQNRGTLLGALLRIDVDSGDPYGIPPDNPFAGSQTDRQEIWAYGLRNPWRFAFDPVDGRLYVADVGQNQWEEVDVVDAGEGGLNYGWNVMEGAHCFESDPCDASGLVLPALEYSHSQGCSITGGYVYRGTELSGLSGHYFYADYCGGWVRSFRFSDGGVTDEREWEVGDVGRPLSFGVDDGGELYLLSDNGTVYRFVPAS